jgi:hypothetical protein
MSITLNTIRYHSASSPYHYTIDNQPLQDLESNDIALKNAIEAVQSSFSTVVQQGSWSGFQITMPLTQERNKAFAYKFSIWALQDKAALGTQISALIDINVLGASDIGGNVTISAIQLISNVQALGALVPALTPTIDGIQFTFTGYSGLNGYALLKAERLGF